MYEYHLLVRDENDRNYGKSFLLHDAQHNHPQTSLSNMK